MSPEANTPDTKPETKTFVPDLHPTDGVLPFDQGLDTVGGTLLKPENIPEDVSNLDPDSLNVRHLEKIEEGESLHDVTPALETESPIVPPEVPLNTETHNSGGNRKTLYTVIGGVAAGVAATTAVFLGLSGDKEAAEPQPQPSASANVNSGELPNAEPTPGESAEVVDPTANIDILAPSGTAQEVLGDYSSLISNIINNRVDGGNVTTDNTDLHYLTNSQPGLEDFQGFVQRTAANLESARALYEKNGISNIDIYLYTNFISSEPTADGGFVIESVDEYWAIGEDEQSVGSVIANLDPHRYTFGRAEVTLPDGSSKDTFVLTGFEPGSADPSQIG